MTSVTFPWPPKELAPNSRKKHLHTTSIRRRYKADCWALTLASCLDRNLTHLDITFHPPDGRRRDLDNMLASCKAGLDGMADAMSVNDYQWREITVRRGVKDLEKKGYVVVTLKEETNG